MKRTMILVAVALVIGMTWTTKGSEAQEKPPLRVAIAGTTVSPGIFESVALLGRDETLARVDAALDGGWALNDRAATADTD